MISETANRIVTCYIPAESALNVDGLDSPISQLGHHGDNNQIQKGYTLIWKKSVSCFTLTKYLVVSQKNLNLIFYTNLENGM